MQTRKERVADMRNQIKLTRNKIALMTTLLGVDAKEHTLDSFLGLLEGIYFDPFLIGKFLDDYEK